MAKLDQTRLLTLPSLPGEPRATQHPVIGQLLHRSPPPLWLAIPFLAPRSYFCNHLADAFEWLLKNNYHIQDLMHESDNYFTVGSPNSSVHAHNVETIPGVASQVGIPLTPDKLVGPSTRLFFLSILTLLAESQFLPPTSNVISINIGLKTALYYTETIPKISQRFTCTSNLNLSRKAQIVSS